MFDETNKTEEMNVVFPDNLFGNDDKSSSADTYEENHTEEDSTEEKVLTIKYNGEEREISLDEAKILAQKGMNYDHVVAERDTKYKRELDFLDKMAAEQGMSRAQYISAREADIALRREDLKEENAFDGKELLQKGKNAVSAAWGNLFKAYPILSEKEVASGILDDVKSGLTPLEAYQKKLLEEQEKELRAMRQNETTANRAVGSMTSDMAVTEKDDFLEGFSFDD